MKQHDDSSKGSFSSGGHRIDNHKFWAGSGSKDSVFPKGVHHKDESSAEGAGSVMRYEDSTEAIKKGQEHGEKKVKARPLTDSNRN
jgi:hypothetical protein